MGLLLGPCLPEEERTDVLDVTAVDDNVVTRLLVGLPVVVATTDVVILLPSDVFALLRETEAEIVTGADEFVKVLPKPLASTEADVATVVMPTVALAAVSGVDM